MVPTDRFDRPDLYSQYWLNSASDLHAGAAATWHAMSETAADVLRKTYGLGDGFSTSIALYPVFLLLCGYSIELIMKATIVERGGRVPPTHDLGKLAASIDLGANDDQLNILQQLTHATKWRGRYPKPRTRTEWDEYSRVHAASMVPSGKGALPWMTANPARRLRWDTYNDIWRACMARYMTSCTP